MYFYLSPYRLIADHIKNNGLLWQPIGGEQSGASWVDLRPVGETDGMALLGCPFANPDPLLTPLGADRLDSVAVASKIALQNTLKLSGTIASVRVHDLCLELLSPAMVKGWNPLQPLASGLKEVWLGGQHVAHDAPAKGSGGLGGLSIGIDDAVLRRCDFGSKKDLYASVMDWFGYVPVLVALALSYRHPELFMAIGMALPKTDAFTGTDTTLLTIYDTGWIATKCNAHIQANSATGFYVNTGDGNSDVIVRWMTDAFANNHYAKGTVGATGTGNYTGVSVRGAGLDASTTAAGYYCGVQPSDYNPRKYVASVRSNLQAAFNTTLAGADLIEMQAEGSTIRFTKNATALGSSPYTDTSLATGAAGMGGIGESATYASMTTLEMGDLGRASKNTRAMTLGTEIGTGFRMPV